MRRAALSAFCLVALAGVRAAGGAEAADGARLPDEKAGKKARAEQARLQGLVRLSERGANPAALIPHFRKLAKKAMADHVRREAAYRLGAVCLGVRKTAEAERLFNDLSRSGEDTWTWKAAVELGGIRRARGELDEAIESYERILRKNVTEREAVIASLAVAGILVERGDKENARKALAYGRAVAKRLYKEDREALKDTLKAMARLARSLDREKKVAEKGEAAVLLREGNAALARKNYKAALAKYSELLERFADSDEADEAGYKKGLALYHSARPDEARTCWEGFVRTKPEGPWRGQTLVGLGDIELEHKFNYAGARQTYETAETRLKKAAHESWRRAAPLIYERLGLCEYIKGKFDAAAGWFERASRARPPEPARAEGGWPPAGQWLVDACRRREFPSPRHLLRQGTEGARLAVFLADAYYLAERYRKAAGIFERVHRGKIKGATLHQRAYACARHGWCHYMLFEWDEAKKVLADVEKLYLPSPEARRGLFYFANILCAYIKFERNDAQETERILRLIVSHWPKTEEGAKAQIGLAASLYTLGRYGQAMTEAKRMLQRYPNHWAAEWMREHHIPRIKEALKRNGPRSSSD